MLVVPARAHTHTHYAKITYYLQYAQYIRLILLYIIIYNNIIVLGSESLSELGLVWVTKILSGPHDDHLLTCFCQLDQAQVGWHSRISQKVPCGNNLGSFLTTMTATDHGTSFQEYFLFQVVIKKKKKNAFKFQPLIL